MSQGVGWLWGGVDRVFFFICRTGLIHQIGKISGVRPAGVGVRVIIFVRQGGGAQTGQQIKVRHWMSGYWFLRWVKRLSSAA